MIENNLSFPVLVSNISISDHCKSKDKQEKFCWLELYLVDDDMNSNSDYHIIALKMTL